MADLNKLLTPLFLSEKEIRKIIELMFFAYRDFTSEPDALLENINFGRAHHRVIYFVEKKKKITIKELLSILQITKQSLSRVLNQLVKEKYIILSIGEDKRTKNLSLTKKGHELENELSTIQIKKIKNILKNANEDNINGFKTLLYEMIDDKNKTKFDKLKLLKKLMISKSILIIDDDKRLRELLEDYLKEKKYKIYMCDDFSSANEILQYFLFDLAIIDRMMPSGDGIDLIKIIKESKNIPVIMLTALGESENRIQGLQYGADDYLSKPFEPEELYLRIKKLLNLYKDKTDKKIAIIFGNFVFNISTLQLKKNSTDIYLTEGETELLLKLIDKRNNIVLREELADRDFDENELRKVDVQVTRLRQKIEENPKQPHFIKTIRGKGYKLVCDEL